MPEETNHINGKRILLAEDMKLNQYLMTQLLADQGAQLVTASDGHEAVDLCKEQLFDIIILDIQMPRMDGVAACIAIRKLDNANATAPILALTAHMFEEEQLRFFSSGMNAAIMKPVEKEPLLSLLFRLLNNTGGQDTLVHSSVATNDLAIDLTYLLRIGNNSASFIKMMLDSFLHNAEQLQKQLQMALDKSDLRSIGEIAHQLKFSLGVLGVKGLDEKIGWLQEHALSAEEQDIDWFMERSRRLQLKLKIICDQAQELQAQYSQRLTGNA